MDAFASGEYVAPKSVERAGAAKGYIGEVGVAIRSVIADVPLMFVWAICLPYAGLRGSKYTQARGAFVRLRR